jgi:hypothetical protein
MGNFGIQTQRFTYFVGKMGIKLRATVGVDGIQGPAQNRVIQLAGRDTIAQKERPWVCHQKRTTLYKGFSAKIPSHSISRLYK